MDMENIFMGKILLVDLDAGTCEEEDLEEELVEESLGGAAVNLALYKKYIDRDPIVMGTGPLTGTFAPSGCAGVVTGKSPVSGRVCHVPLLWQTAVELKYSGFDFLVVLGTSQTPVRLWLHDELAEILGAEEVWGKDVWETTDWLRDEHGDDYVQVLGIGPAAENGSPLAQLSENHWGSRDIYGLGTAFGARKLKAIAMRGMGGLDVADDFFPSSLKAQKDVLAGDFFKNKGMKPILASLGAEEQDLEAAMKGAHRSSAAFNCAYAPYTFLMTEEPPDLVTESKKDEPGLLLTDPAGILSLLFLKEEMPAVLARINRLGLEPVACGALLKKESITDPGEVEKRLKELAGGTVGLAAAGVENVCGVAPWPLTGTEEDRLVQAAGIFSHAIPIRPVGGTYSDFSAPEDAEGRALWWLERMAACSILGICPLSALLSPVFSLGSMAQWASQAADLEDLDEETLRGKCRALISETLSLGNAEGALPDGWGSAEAEAFLSKLQQG